VFYQKSTQDEATQQRSCLYIIHGTFWDQHPQVLLLFCCIQTWWSLTVFCQLIFAKRNYFREVVEQTCLLMSWLYCTQLCCINDFILVWR